MSRVTTVFRLSIYAMVAIASVMLAIAEGAAFPQLLVPPLAVLAYFLVERARRFILPDLIANVLGLVAFAAAGWEFFDENIEGRILSGAHLLIYLSLIVLFQKKSSVQYWWMCALSVLMVAVGAVLTNDETYGAMLLGFMVFSIWTLSVFSLHQAQLQFGRSDGDNGDASRAGMNTNAVAQPVRVTNIS
ncbi:MAG: transglutaminaseTgpA domain-containing protein, partial [Planctomycetaceae bacterium]